MKKELNYYDFDLLSALEKEFTGDKNYEAKKAAEKEYEKRISEWQQRHPLANAQRIKGKKYQWRKSLFSGINFNPDFKKLEEKYQVLKRTVLIEVDGRKYRNPKSMSMLKSQIDMAVEMGHSSTLITSNTGERAYILRVTNY